MSGTLSLFSDEGIDRIPTEHRNFMQLQLTDFSDRESCKSVRLSCLV